MELEESPVSGGGRLGRSSVDMGVGIGVGAGVGICGGKITVPLKITDPGGIFGTFKVLLGVTTPDKSAETPAI